MAKLNPILSFVGLFGMEWESGRVQRFHLQSVSWSVSESAARVGNRLRCKAANGTEGERGKARQGEQKAGLLRGRSEGGRGRERKRRGREASEREGGRGRVTSTLTHEQCRRGPFFRHPASWLLARVFYNFLALAGIKGS